MSLAFVAGPIKLGAFQKMDQISMQKAHFGLLAASFVVAFSSAALAAPYTFQTITVPNAGPVTSTVVSGINDVGQVVGTVTPAGSTPRGFIDNLASGAETIFFDPNSVGTFGNGINNQGQVVGSMAMSFGGPSGYERDPVSGAFTRIWLYYTTPMGFSAYGINNAGQIVGDFPVASSIPRDQAFLANSPTSGSLFFQAPFAGGYTDGYGLNDLGQVVGSITFPQSPTTAIITGFVGVPTTNSYTLIKVPGATTTIAYGINDNGQVVGSYQIGSTTDAFLLDLSTGTYTTLTDPGATSTIAYGINNAGQIVGSFTDGNGVQNGFLATPAALPEPTSIALLGGICALACACRQGRFRPMLAA